MKSKRWYLLTALFTLVACTGEDVPAHKKAHVSSGPGEIMNGFPPPPEKVATIENWMQPDYITWSLSHMRELIQTKQVWRGPTAATALKYTPKPIANITVQNVAGATVPLQQLLTETKTDAFLVLHEGNIVYEQYWNTKANEAHWTASLSKVFTGLLIGALVEEGKISLQKKASMYIPELANTAFGEATVQQLLDMEVAASYSTHDPNQKELAEQDTQLFVASGQLPPIEKGPTSIYNMLQGAKEEEKPGETFSYNNGSAETLGWIARRVSNQSLTELMEERIWKKIQPEEDAYYITDRLGTEQASAGLNVTLHDLARFGNMVLNHGQVKGKQILPESIFTEIEKGGDPKLLNPKLEADAKESPSYHNMWWIAGNANKVFEVIGSYGQRLYIDPTHKMVIVQFSSLATYNNDVHEALTAAYDNIGSFINKEK